MTDYANDDFCYVVRISYITLQSQIAETEKMALRKTEGEVFQVEVIYVWENNKKGNVL